MLEQYIWAFIISMVPVVELRGAVLYAVGCNLPLVPSLIVCVLGNMLPVPFIYFFARKLLTWGSEKKYIGKVCNALLKKGERGGQKLVKKTGRGGLFVALLLFVGIPLPGTGAWTGTMAASFLNMGFKSTVVSVCLGVLLAGLIVSVVGVSFFTIFSL